MKRILPFTALCILTALAGCADRTLESVHIHEFDGSTALCEGRSESMTISIKAECPEKGATEQALKEIRETIKTAVLGKNYTVLNFEDGFKVFSDSLINDYKKQNADIISHFGTEKIASLNWEYQTTGKFTGSRGRYTTYTVDKYSYTGGAHGMPWTTNYVFDLRDGHIVDESEIFTDDYKPLLSELLTAHARDNAENPENMTLFVSEVEPNGNFEVSEDGITYIYNPYDIAPYSEGIISITIPWKELKSILK